MFGGLSVDVVAAGHHVGLDCLGNGIGAGEHAVIAKAGGAVAGDAEELLDDLAGLDTAAPGQRYHAADGFALGSGAPAGLAHGGEQLEQTGVVFVYRDVERTATGLHLVGPAA